MKPTLKGLFIVNRYYIMLGCLICTSLAAADNPPVTACDPDKKIIDHIEINVQNVFDENNPDENNWLFRQVNRFHINTKPSVVKQDLLFKEGEAFDQHVIDESARKLRSRPYLNGATITTPNPCDEQTRVHVDLHEVWTLLPEISYSHSGGNSNYGFGLHDSNFLGYGKTVNLSHTSTAERTGNLFEYYDPNTGIEDSIFSVYYADNSDGIHKSTSLIKPFAALETTWSAGLAYEDFSQEDTLYNAGKEVDRFAHTDTNQSYFYGVRLEQSAKDSIHRVLVGYNTRNDHFFPVGVAPQASIYVPGDRQYNYPWIEYQHIDDGFIQARNIDQINRVEDINLGAEIRTRVGYTNSDYAPFDKNIKFEAEYSQGFPITAKQLLLAHWTASGLYDKTQVANTLVTTTLAYHWQNTERGQFYVGYTNSKGFHLFGDTPLELGGDIGLRGYPARYQAGDHLQLLNVEQRFFGEKEWFSLFYLGAAIFYDEGKVWGDSAIPQSQQGRLRDYGIGLRFSGTRNGNRDAGGHNIVHLDIASPLDGDKDIAKVQWIVRVKHSL